MSPQRATDAANIQPYPFVVRQERQPPENADRNGKPKKSKPRPRAERNLRQDDEPRFNTGPRNFRGPQVNRGSRRPFRMLGRHDRGYDEGIPDYPPPSFQEATMTTPPLSACSSTTTLVPVSIPTVLITENIPEVPESLAVPLNVETLNETIVSDGSHSDESLDIIDKNSVVCSEDPPKGVELQKRVRSDWKSQHRGEFPGRSSSDSLQKQADGTDADRGRAPGSLTINSNASLVENNSNTPPTSPTKRRLPSLSLSPLRTMLAPRLMTDPDRPMSAHPSPCSSPYAASSRNIFFRSSTSLATSSMMKLPLSPGKNDNSAPRKLFAKGKEKLETWEVLDEENYPNEFEVGGYYPDSLMSAIQSLKLSTPPTVGNSPIRSQSFSIGASPPVSQRTKQVLDGFQGGAMHEANSLVSSLTHQNTSLRDKKGPSSAFLDRKILRPPASASSVTSSSMAVSLSPDSPPRPISPVRVSPILKHTVPPLHPSPLRPIVVTENQASSSIYQQALDTPLPATPVHRTHFDVVVNGAVLNGQETAEAIISARPVPDLLNNSFSAGDVFTTPPIPSLSLGTVNCLAQIKFTEEPMTPSRHHYTGRPLPRPPQSVTRSNIDSTFAPGISAYDADEEGRSSARCPEGLLINLDDTSLDDCSAASGASTPLSDDARLRPQLHLPITPSSSSTDLTVESVSQRSARSGSTAQGGSASPASEVNELFELTELDLLVSRLADGEGDGSDYETLLLVSEIIGPASPTHAPAASPPASTFPKANTNANMSLIGKIEVKRKRETQDGRVKLKLSLLDVRVNKCGICLSQFKGGDKAGLTSICQHSFHETCLARWLARNKTCPLCRVPLDVDIR